MPAGNKKMQEIASAIQEGAMAYLNKQYQVVSVFAIIITVVLYFALGEASAIGFFAGAFISGTAMLIILFWIKNLIKFGEKVGDELIIELGKVMMVGIAFEILLTFNEYLQLTYGTDDEFVYLKYILLGVMGTYYFWLNVVALVASFIILAVTPLRKRVGGVILASTLVVAAILGMRHWWVYGGQYLQTFF